MKKLILSMVFLTLSSAAHADITTGLIGWWKFDEGSGSTATDSSGNSNTGTEYNSPSYVSGKIGSYALSFNGTSQYVDVPNSSSLQITGNLTISFWINNITSDANYNTVVSKGNVNEYEIGIDFRNGACGANCLSLRAGSPVDTITNWGGFFTGYLNTWTFVAVVISGTNATAYLNGVSQGTISIQSRSSSTNDVFIGQRSPSSSGFYLPATLDDVRIYNRALASSDVTQLFGNGVQLHQFNHAHLTNFKTTFY